ncbi:MAG: hypothetical protein GF364_13260 [Candidatus Lokiarchaeota archaeon]|nr:hypothetical protein [Candidatus Lokiarchaeota archaeon]
MNQQRTNFTLYFYRKIKDGNKKVKTLILGPANAGKTSLMRTTCLGYSFVKVANLKATKGISRETFIFRGLLELNVWDAGGQERYLERYFSESRTAIFSEVDIAIFMVDAIRVEHRIKDVFDEFLSAIKEYSPNLKKIYILINKIDLDDSKEDEVFKLLTKDLDKEIHDKCAFTPVSVKTGSAQHRLIEILDTNLQNSILEMQKMSRIRSVLEKIKQTSFFDVILFNRPDGLIISSTLGKFESEPLKFMTLEIGSLESNIHSIYSKMMTLAKKKVNPIELSILIYESEMNYVLVKEVSDTAIMLLISPDKDNDKLMGIMDLLSSKESPIQNLKTELKHKSF